MNDILTISLNHLRFFAYHGLYAEEKKIGAEFEVNLIVSFPAENTISELNNTVNYEKLFQLLKDEMQKPRELLETFAMEVSESIHQSFPSIKKNEISITKLHPPIKGFTGNVSVNYLKEF